MSSSITSLSRIRAIGIDPGLATSGYAIVETLDRGVRLLNWGSLKTTPKSSYPDRLMFIYESFKELLHKWNPFIFVLEDIYVASRFPKASIRLGEILGILKLCARINGVEILEIHPTEVKKALTGYGKASKKDINREVKRILREDINSSVSFHQTDAAALAIIGLSRKSVLRW